VFPHAFTIPLYYEVIIAGASVRHLTNGELFFIAADLRQRPRRDRFSIAPDSRAVAAPDLGRSQYPDHGVHKHLADIARIEPLARGRALPTQECMITFYR
jgi:hypothetical protein